jgi:hypothetical protein
MTDLEVPFPSGIKIKRDRDEYIGEERVRSEGLV